MSNWFPGLTIEEMERDAILAALKFYQGNRTRAADALGIAIRTMTNKIAKYKELGFKVPDNEAVKPEARASA